MRCEGCGADNPADSVFCRKCGARLTLVCAACRTPRDAEDAFCRKCGQAVSGSPSASPAPAAAPARELRAYTPKHLTDKILITRDALRGERKQVTVLFADVQGSMGLQESLDPEEWHRIMDGFFAVLAEGVHKYEGTVNQFTGDGIMALFGAPLAHEDHAHRACYATLHLREHLAVYANELRRTRGLNFSVRMGLNSGEVVVGAIGDDLRLDYTAIGHTVGLAQRMEALAESGHAYLTADTATLVGGFFDLADLGAYEIKGVSEPVHVYSLQGTGAHRTRLDASRARGFSKFVGRVDEMRTLEAALERACSGDGHVIGLVALPGTGKSRLCYEFLAGCRRADIAVYEGHGVAHGTDIPFLPILEFARGYFGITKSDPPQQAREKIAGRLLLIDSALTTTLPVVFDFLGVPDPQRPVPAQLDPEARQRQVFGLFQQVLRSGAEHAVLLFEDLHWFDPGSRQFMDKLVEAAADSTALVLLTYRPEFEAEWTRQSIYQQIPLPPLGPGAITELLDDLLGTDASLNGVPDLVRDRTAGNPFFIEEAIQALAEEGSLAGARGAYRLTRPIEQLTIPATVQAMLAARIDRLSERDKRVLQTAAVIGRTAPDGVIRRVAAESGADLDAALHALVTAELLYESALYPETEYTFRHALTQEVAYDSQLTDQRALIHRSVAKAIEALYPDNLDERAALLGHHWEAAREPLHAAEWYARAARWVAVHDPAESSRYWRKVRALVAETPLDRATATLDVQACIQLINHGWRVKLDVDEAGRLFDEGSQRLDAHDDPRLRVLLLERLATLYWLTGYRDEHGDLSSEAVRLADATGDAALRVVARIAHMVRQLSIGNTREGLAACEAGIDIAGGNLRLGAEYVGFHPVLLFMVFRADCLAVFGDIAESRAAFEEVRRLAREVDDTEILCWADSLYGDRAAYAGDVAQARMLATEGAECALQAGGSLSHAYAHDSLGFMHLAAGEWGQACRVLESGLEAAHTNQFPYYIIRMSGLQAVAQLHGGQVAAATATAAWLMDMAPYWPRASWLLPARLACAHVVRHAEGAAAADRIRTILDTVDAICAETGDRIHLPFVCIERAALAELLNDPAERDRQLREAERLFTEMGMPIRAEQVRARLVAGS